MQKNDIYDFLSTCYEWTPASKKTARWHLIFWRDYELPEITIPLFEERTKHMSPSARHNNLWSLKSYLRANEIEKHPLLSHKVRRKLGPLPPYLTLGEVRTLIESCDITTHLGLRDAALISFLWDTWARANETICARVEYLRMDEQEMQLRLKGMEWGIAVFGPDTRDLLEKWLVVRAKIAKPGVDTLFIGVHTGRPLTYWGFRQVLVDRGLKVGIDVKAHAFRRGAARNHREEGGSVRDGVDRGRWKTVQMFVHYSRGVKLDKFKKKRWRSDD